MRLTVCLCLVALSAAPCRAQSSQPGASPPVRLTERDTLARMMAADPRMRSLAARVEETRAVQADRALWPNPSATFSKESVLNSHDTFLLARQEVPISGRRGHLQMAGRLAVDAAEAEIRFERVRLQADVRDAYTALAAAQQREVVLQDTIASLEKLVAVLQSREEAGEGSTYDRMRGQRALVDLEAERALAAGARTRAQGVLAGYLGPGTDADALVAADPLATTSPAVPLPALIAQALANRGDYQSVALSIERYEAERSAAGALRIPTPTFTGGLKHSDFSGTSSSGYQVSVDLSVPLFSRGQAASALAIAQRTRAEAEAESWRLRIDAEVRAAYNLARIHHEEASRYQESAAAIAEPLVKIGRVGYEEGELGILELLDAERQALDARLQGLELVAAARRAAIELDRLTGQELKP